MTTLLVVACSVVLVTLLAALVVMPRGPLTQQFHPRTGIRLRYNWNAGGWEPDVGGTQPDIAQGAPTAAIGTAPAPAVRCDATD